MQMDRELCKTYLEMPSSHIEMAQDALRVMDRDAIASRFLHAALAAFAREDAKGAAEICQGAKAYAMQAEPEAAEGFVPAIFALALPGAIARLSAAGLDDAMIRDTLKDYGIWARGYEQEKGRAGFGEIGWEVRFLAGDIYKIGRVQYEHRFAYPAPYSIYRDRETGALLPVPHAGLQIDAQGFLAQGSPAAFTTVCERRDGYLRFSEVDTVRARVVAQVRTLPLSQLEPVLFKGMQVLNMHIPECGPLDTAQVQRSIEAAKAFFEPRGLNCDVAVCESWLLDPALLTYGADCGNICSFQQRFAKYPECTTHSDAVSRVYGRGTKMADVENFAEDTRLRRGLKQYIRENGVLRDAGGVLVMA